MFVIHVLLGAGWSIVRPKPEESHGALKVKARQAVEGEVLRLAGPVHASLMVKDSRSRSHSLLSLLFH